MNGVIYSKDDGYTIYELYNQNAICYYLCINDDMADNYHMYVGFFKDDTVLKSKDAKTTEINDIFKMLRIVDPKGIYVIPDMPTEHVFLEAASFNNQPYKPLYRDIKSVIVHAYNEINNGHNTKFDYFITFISKNDNDRKFIDWLTDNYSNIFDKLSYDELLHKYNMELLNKTMVITPVGDDTSGGTPMEMENPKVKKLTPPSAKAGFGSFLYITFILLMALVMGVGIAYLLIK